MEQIMTRSLSRQQEPTWIDYVTVLLIIAATGFEWCFRYNEMIFFWVGPLAAYMFISRRKKFTIYFYLFAITYFLWACIQTYLDITSGMALFNFGIRLLIYFLAFSSIRNLPKVLVRVIYWICIISLIMYGLAAIPPVRSFLENAFRGVEPIGGFTEDDVRANPGQTMIFYFMSSSLWNGRIRNSGPFWEPGMFAVFANIGLALSLLQSRKLNKESIIILLGSISTFSTTSLIASIFILSYYYMFIHRRASSLFLILLVGAGLIAFLNSDVGLSKIQNDAANDAESSRFGAVLYHLTLIARHPFIGNGFDSHKTFELLTSPNGLTFLIVFWGIPMSILYYIMLFRGIDKLAISANCKNTLDKVFLALVFLIVVFSQDATIRHFYLAMAMYGLTNIANKERRKRTNKATYNYQIAKK